MSTKRTRTTRNLVSDISPTAWWIMGDHVLYPKPAIVDKWELRFDGNKGKDCPTPWEQCRETVLADWIRKFPGTRPSYWWDHDAPRIKPDDDFCEGRKRLGGIGTPKYEVLNYGPSFSFGVPDLWVDVWETNYYNGRSTDIHGNRIGGEHHEGDFLGVPIDPDNPPIFESQATYLKRHNLLEPGEEHRLTAKDFEPEVILPEEEETEPECAGTIH